jgi:hypothetical protein
MMRITLLGVKCLWLVLFLSIVSGEDDQQEEDDDQEVVLSSIYDFHFDEEGKLATNMLLYPRRCAPHVRAAMPDEHEMYHFFAVAGDLERAYFGHIFDSDESNNDCSIVSVQQGLDQKYVTSPMERFFFEPFSSSLSPEPTVDDKENYQELIDEIEDWFETECLTVDINFISYHPKPLDVMWIDPNTLIGYLEQHLEKGEANIVHLTSTLGEKYVIEDTETHEEMLSYTVEFDAFVVVGETPDPDEPEDVRDWIGHAHHNEWERHGKIKRSFNPLGFQLVSHCLVPNID